MRFLKFRLRTLFILLTIVGCCGGMYARHLHGHFADLAALKPLGVTGNSGITYVDSDKPDFTPLSPFS